MTVKATIVAPPIPPGTKATKENIAALKNHVMACTNHIGVVKAHMAASKKMLAALPKADVEAVVIPGYPPKGA